jgi:ubiquinone/menaquinone biosynthesis C-methylase UbiE
MTGGDLETQRVRGLYEDEAPRYDRQMRFFDRVLFGDGRDWACSQAEGDVLEIAVGTGRNLARYPPKVQLTGVELSPAMLEIARRRAAALSRDVDLRVGDAQALEFPEDSFDTVVSTLALCSIPDARRAVSEAKRVLRPGGILIAVEHVRSSVLAVRAVQRILDPLARRFQADHLLREPLEDIRAEGFEIVEQERQKLGIVARLVARKPVG